MPREQWQRIRVPLVGVPNTRAATAGAFLTRDQRFINFIPYKIANPLTQQNTYYCVKRPGFQALNTPSTGNIGTALMVWQAVGTGATILSAFGATNSTIFEGTTSLGAITGRARDITESIATGTATAVISSTNSGAWFYPTAGALTEITDVDYPGNASRTTVGTCVHMDGYTFIMDTVGRIYNSNLNSFSAWTADSYVTPTMFPFHGVGIARHHDTVVAFGKSSIEFYENAGLTPSPLEARDILAIQLGAALPASNGLTIRTVNDQVFFVGMSRMGGGGIYVIDNFRVKKISTQPIDAQIEVFEPQNCTITTGRIWGKDILFLQAGQSFAYNLEDDIWFELEAGDGGTLWQIMAGSPQGDGRLFSVSLTSTSGKVYEVNTDTPVYQDDANAFTATIQTSLIDFNSMARKRIHRVDVLGDDPGAATTIGVSWSDDDYGTFTTARNVDMNTLPAYLMTCGITRRRAFRLTNSTNTACRLHGLEFVFSLMNN